MSQQSLRHASFREIAGTNGSYNEDAMAAFRAEADIPARATFNEAFMRWLQFRLASTDTNLNSLMTAFAVARGAPSWSALGSIETFPQQIANLVAANDGVLFINDISTMYQDAAGTTPVTAVDDPVGRWEDQSGNGNHATQSTAAARPLWTGDTVQGDAVDDWLKTSFTQAENALNIAVAYATVPATTGSVKVAAGHGSALENSRAFLSMGAGGNYSFGWMDDYAAPAGAAAESNVVQIMSGDENSGQMFVNNQQVGSNSIPAAINVSGEDA